MSATNPFTPPRADIGDVHAASTPYATPKAWSARGRLGRLRYLAYSMVAYLVSIVAAGVLGAVAGFANQAELAGAITLLVMAPYAVLAVLLLIQRSHDMGWSGWTVLLCLIPFVILIWMVRPGTAGANRFGPPTPPNTTGVKVAAFGLLLVFAVSIVGVLAAVALPAYQDYTARARAVQIQQP